MGALLYPLGWIRSHPEAGGMIVLASIGLAILYAGAILVAVTRMSPDYFSSVEPAEGTLRRRHPVLRLGLRIIKTVLGLFLFASGLTMLVLPGQGLLTMAVGMSLLDFPGKRRLLEAFVRRSGVLVALNKVRRKAGRPPLADPGARRLGR